MRRDFADIVVVFDHSIAGRDWVYIDWELEDKVGVEDMDFVVGINLGTYYDDVALVHGNFIEGAEGGKD